MKSVRNCIYHFSIRSSQSPGSCFIIEMKDNKTDDLLKKILQTNEPTMKTDEDEDSLFFIDRKFKEIKETNIF